MPLSTAGRPRARLTRVTLGFGSDRVQACGDHGVDDASPTAAATAAQTSA